MIQLRLDADALAALFPEGTEARVKLQHAVIDEFCRHYLKRVVDENVIAPIVNRHATELSSAVRQEVRDKFTTNDEKWPYGAKLDSATVELIKREVTKQTHNERDKLVSTVAAELLNADLIKKLIKSQLDYSIKAEVSKRVQAQLAAAVKTIAEGG